MNVKKTERIGLDGLGMEGWGQCASDCAALRLVRV